MTRIFYSTWVKPACCVSKISSDGGCQSKETGVGMEVRLLSVGARGFFLAASRLSFAASPLNSVVPNEKNTSGTQGRYKYTICLDYMHFHKKPKLSLFISSDSKCSSGNYKPPAVSSFNQVISLLL